VLALVLATLAGCASPEVAARRILDARYLVGDPAAGLAEVFARRGYSPVDCPSDPARASGTLGCGPNVGVNSVTGENASRNRPPSTPSCMVRVQQHYLASGFIVCWVVDDEDRIVWRHADWYVGTSPPLKAR